MHILSNYYYYNNNDNISLIASQFRENVQILIYNVQLAHNFNQLYGKAKLVIHI